MRLLDRLRSDAAELSELLDAGPALSEAWRTSFAKDATDFTIDRIGDDEASWFAWWAYLLEHGERPTFAVVSRRWAASSARHPGISTASCSGLGGAGSRSV